MTSRPGASHRRDVVHPRRFDTVGILLTDCEPCLALAHEDAAKQSGRTNIRRVTQWRDLASNFGAHLNSVGHDDFCRDSRCAFREMDPASH